MDSLKISVITVCYNAVKTIEDTMLSVFNQTYQNVEYIIIDGGSVDGTVDIIKKYLDKVAYFVSERDNGIYDAMNKGLEVATGDYVNFMNAGDLFYNNTVLARVANEIVWESDVVFGDVAYKFDDIIYREKANPFYNHLPLHHSMGFNHQCTFVKAQLARSLKFDLKYKLASDYNMIISIFKNKGSFQQLNDLIVAIYNFDGVSSHKRRRHIYETMVIDNPFSKLNWVNSYIQGGMEGIREIVKRIVMIVCPDFLTRQRNSRWDVISVKK